jgi:hypothetical protein
MPASRRAALAAGGAQRQPEHPASVLVRGDVLLRGVLEIFALRLFGPQRRALLAQDLPNLAGGEVAAWLTLVQALQRTIADLQDRQAQLVRTLEERDYPGGTFFEQIAQRLGDLDREQQPNWPSCGPWSPNSRRPMRSRWSYWICCPCSRPRALLHWL